MLPMQGVPVPCRKLARKSAALEAVKELHKAGELDCYLNPVLPKQCDSDEEDKEKMMEKKVKHAGTNKRVLYYRNKVNTLTT